MNSYATGDDIDLLLALKLNGVPDTIAGGTFKAALVQDGQRKLAFGTAPVTAILVDAVAATVAALFPASMTIRIAPGRYQVEVQMIAAGRVVTYSPSPIEIYAGLIP